MPNRLRIVEGALHGPQDHRGKRRVERVLLDRLEKLGKHLLIGDIAHLHSKRAHIGAKHQKLLLIWRLMKTRQNLDTLRPKLRCHGFIRCHHALLHHLMRLIIRTRDYARHFAKLVENNLSLWNLDIKRA